MYQEIAPVQLYQGSLMHKHSAQERLIVTAAVAAGAVNILLASYQSPCGASRLLQDGMPASVAFMACLHVLYALAKR